MQERLKIICCSRRTERICPSHKKKLAREIEHHQEFVDRFGVSNDGVSCKQGEAYRKAQKIASVHADLATTKIKIACPHVPTGTAVYTEDLEVGYGEKVIVDKLISTSIAVTKL